MHCIKLRNTLEKKDFSQKFISWVHLNGLKQKTKPSQSPKKNRPIHAESGETGSAVGQGVDLVGGETGPEAVVDVHHGHAAAAAVEHAEQGGEALEACAIADAGGHCDYGFVHKAGNNARQRAFHASDDDDEVNLKNILRKIILRSERHKLTNVLTEYLSSVP